MSSTRILVVEDDPTLRSSLTTLLVEMGFDTWATTNGAEALEIISKKSLDVAIIDLQLPHVDGGCLVRKGHALQPSLKFLVQTALANYRVPKCLENLGVTRADVLHKPLRDPAVLLRAIRHATAGCVEV